MAVQEQYPLGLLHLVQGIPATDRDQSLIFPSVIPKTTTTTTSCFLRPTTDNILQQTGIMNPEENSPPVSCNKRKWEAIELLGSATTKPQHKIKQAPSHFCHGDLNITTTQRSTPLPFLTSRLGHPLPSQTPQTLNESALISSYFSNQLLQQEQEFRQFLLSQLEVFNWSLEEKRQQQTRVLIESIEEGIHKELYRRGVEIEKLRHHSQSLESRLKDSAIEAYYWQSKAQNNEALVVALRATLLRVIAQTQEQLKEGSGESDLDEAASIHIGEKIRGLEDSNGDKDLLWPCKICRSAEASILLMPCRHLCCCENCENSTQSCPLCLSPKTNSVKIYLS